jgi:hypothetical protein
MVQLKHLKSGLVGIKNIGLKSGHARAESVSTKNVMTNIKGTVLLVLVFSKMWNGWMDP